MDVVAWIALGVSVLGPAAWLFDRIVVRGGEKERLKTLELLSGTQSASLELLKAQFGEFKVKVAETYVPNHELAAAMREVKEGLSRIDGRLDRLLGPPARTPPP